MAQQKAVFDFNNFETYDLIKKVKPALNAFCKTAFKVEVEGLENINREDGFIIASNHSIIYDPAFLATVCERQLHYIAKNEAFQNPVARFVLTRCNAFPVVRGKGDLTAINYASELVKRGEVLCIFPEGTRSKDGYPKKAKSGVGKIARDAKCDVVPVAICLENRDKFGSKVYIKFGEAIKYEDMGFTEDGGTKENKEVAGRVMDEIILLWRELRKKCV